MTDTPAAARPSRKRRYLQWSIASVATALLLGYLLYSVDFTGFAQLVARANPTWVAAAVLFYVLITLVRALRFKMLSPAAPVYLLFCISSVHWFMLRILPLRMGELSFGILMRRTAHAGFGRSMVGLVLLRIMELATLLGFFTISVSLSREVYLGNRTVGIVVATLAMLAALASVLFFHHLLSFLRWLIGRISGGGPSTGVLGKMSDALGSFSKLTKREVVVHTILAAAASLLSFATVFATMRALGIEISFIQAVLGGTGATLAAVLPLSVIGTFGTTEAGWALGFMLVGVNKQQAIASGLAFSGLTFVTSCVLASIGWLVIVAASQRQPTDAADAR